MAARGGKRTANAHYQLVYDNKRLLADDDYRLLVPTFLSHKVIGSGGSVIKKISESIKDIYERGRIMVYHDQLRGGPLMEGAADRVIGIRASPEALQVALEMLIPIIQMPHSPEVNFKSELRIMVPYQTCANVCGLKGANINKIREETDSYIAIYKVSLPRSEERLIRIQNSDEERLLKTAMMVWESIAPFKKENPIVLYEPFYFEQREFGDTGSFIDTCLYQEELSKNKGKSGGDRGRGESRGGMRGRGDFRGRGGMRGMGMPRGGMGMPRGGMGMPMGGMGMPRGGMGMPRGGMGMPRGGMQQPPSWNEPNFGNNIDFDYPQNQGAQETQQQGETAVYWDNDAQDTFEETKPATPGELDADKFAQALAQGIAIGMKQAMNMGLVGSQTKETPNSQTTGPPRGGAMRGGGPTRGGPRGGGPMRGGPRGGGFRNTPYGR